MTKTLCLLGTLALLGALLAVACSAPEPAPIDPLPSWAEGATRSAIIQFVADVTEPGGPKYVPPEERIATFDNDGTLWCEQPVAQMSFAIHRIKAMAPDHPEWKDVQPFKAVLEGDEKYLVNDLLKGGGHELGKILAFTNAGMSLDEFTPLVEEFLETVDHPRYDVPFNELAYLPMLELLEFLRAADFKTYICSGGGVDFMRAFSEETYGVVPENVIGTFAVHTFEKVDGEWVIVKGMSNMFLNDKANKPVAISTHIGRIPILAAGNVRSGGDMAQLRYSQTNSRPSLQILVNHDDAEREFAYAEKDNASLNAAQENGWVVVSMKNDWLRIFPKEAPATK